MRILCHFAGITLLLASQILPAAQSPVTIEGTVTDAETREPMAGVRVTLTIPNSFSPLEARAPQPQAVTDEQGRFSIQTRETGRFRLVPSKDGWIYARPAQIQAPAEAGVWIQVSAGARIENIQLNMARPATITGRLVTAEGQPIVGNTGSIRLMRYTYTADGTRRLSEAAGTSSKRPDDRGEFRFYDVPPGEYYLCASGGSRPVIGGTFMTCFPGPVEEAKAVSIRIGSGEELRMGTLPMLLREKGVEVKLQLTGIGESRTREVRFPHLSIDYVNASNPSEIVLSMMPGHHDFVVINGSSGSPDRRSAFVSLDVVGPTVREVALRPAPAVTGNLLLESATGERAPAPPSVRCVLRSPSVGLANCRNSKALPGIYEVDIQDLPLNTYVVSAKAGDRDLLAEGVSITGDTSLEIVLASPGGTVHGTVRTANGDILPGSTVVLVPDAPYRGAGVRYKSVVTDPGGNYEIHGIAPGSYKLFAWPSLEGAAYRNAEFMKDFEEKGNPIRITKGGKESADLTAF